MQIDSRQLTALAAVLREGTFEAAARALNVTPSAVSQRIKQLEERLGRVLIQRGAPCVATQAGQSLQRHALQLQLLEAQALAPFGLAGGARRALPLAVAVNADSLATWFAPALGAVCRAHDVTFDLVVEDQDHSSDLLRQGRVLAAVTTDPHAVQGCKVERLGAMRYVAIVSPAYKQRWFADGVTDAALAAAPCNVFNRKLTRRRLHPPVHFIPSVHGFVHASLQGIGWGMSPDVLVMPLLKSGDLVELAPGVDLQVPLFWQYWKLDSDVLQALTAAVRGAARDGLIF
jgi:LysR family transcriptional regulator, chromosome initiation inhibitor